MAVDVEAQLARLAELTPVELRELQIALVSAFDVADTADEVDKLGTISDQIETVKTQIAKAPATSAEPEKPAAAPAAPAATPAPAAPVAEEVKPAEPVATSPPVAEVPSAEPVAEAPAVVEAPAPAAVDTPPVAVDVAADVPVLTEVPAAPAAVIEPTVAVQEGLPVAASATTTAVVPQGAAPVITAGATPRVYVGHSVPGFAAGAELTSNKDFADALSARINTLMRLNGGDGEQVVIASIKTDAPSERTLTMNDSLENGDKIRAITEPDALVVGDESKGLVAAGGCCAPLVTKYDLWDNGGETTRPVRDALAGFRADRGGIRFYAGPALADVQGALGFWTCADDVAADPATPSTWKVCARINCPPEQTAELQAITMCLTFGVLQTRIFPELAVANNKLLQVAQARLADAALLAQIKAGSYAVTDGGTAWGAVRDLMSAVGRASMYYRDRYRISSAPLRAIIPIWVLEVMRTELMIGPDWGRPFGQHYGVSEDEVRSFFAARNINVTFALDSSAPATEGGGFFPQMSGNALPAYPTSVQWALYPEGSWLFLDGGQLDLGVVRDSTLVRVNDYMTFSETFEAAAKIGGESLWITSAINISGAYPAAI